jgi:HPt (histidine-containing phosphotransfer) domain-containing protein
MRAHQNPRKAAVRIIALTASVAPAQVQNYLAAGMDAVVGKPLQFDELCRTLADPGAAAPSAPVNGSPPDAIHLLDTPLIAQHRTRLGDEQFSALLGTLRSQIEEILSALRSCRNATEQALHFHKLAGACSNFGLAAAAAECRRLETLTANGKPCTELESLEELVLESQRQLTTVCERIAASA